MGIVRHVLAVACLLVVTALSAHAVLAQTVIFKRPADNVGAITIRVLTSDEDVTPSPIEQAGDTWSYVVQHEAGVWRTEPTFLIDLPARTMQENGIESDAVTVQLSFSFKSNQAGTEIEVPIAFFKGVGVNARKEIYDMLPFQFYEKVMMAQALALRYIDRLPEPSSSQARFATRIWFDSIAAAAQLQNRPVRIGAALNQTLEKVFASDPATISYVRGTAEQLRARTWLDYYDLPDLIENDCVSAAALVGFLKKHHVDHPGDAKVIGVETPDQVLTRLQGQSDRGCPAP